MSASNTRVIITSTGEEYNVPGEWTVENVVLQFADSVQGIANLDASTELVDDGDTLEITFSPRTGTKG